MQHWIKSSKSKPPNNLVVEVQGSDLRGSYSMQAKYVYYKGKNEGRWMHCENGHWYKYPHQAEIQEWREITIDTEIGHSSFSN